MAKRIEYMLKNPASHVPQSGAEDTELEITTRVKAKECENLTADYLKTQSISEYVREIYDRADAILFVSNTALAVRMTAPCIRQKTTDPAVLVTDETGKYCIPLLSGHYGGVNALAQRISGLTGAEAVITTEATRDEHFAIEEFVRKNHLIVKDWKKLRRYSDEISGGDKVQLSITVSPYINENPNTVWLVPKCINVGIGCKKHTEKERIEEAVTKTLKRCKISEDAVKLIVSADANRSEPGLVRFCLGHQWMLATYSEEELAKAYINRADFGGKTAENKPERIEPENICECSALAAGGDLISKKTVYPGVTVALSMDEIVLNW